ncbi:MAG: hypothetical protein INQ03_03770 [Candidatus Heimdallarchaeota archaeon]|nr:hypothetical protein [Candidatus Heimdallarchaeota archaeon]
MKLPMIVKLPVSPLKYSKSWRREFNGRIRFKFNGNIEFPPQMNWEVEFSDKIIDFFIKECYGSTGVSDLQVNKS